MERSGTDVLESLRPSRRAKIMDLVAAAGIDVAPWAKTEDGSPVKSPSANPHYCYEWAFGGDGQPTALCVWHVSLSLYNGVVSYQGNLREEAIELERAAEDYFKPSAQKSRARDQAKRARGFDLRIQHAFRRQEPVRVITLVGQKKRDAAGPGLSSSKVEYRLLDPEPWYVDAYDDRSGACRLLRRQRPAVPAPEDIDVTSGPVFVDQFSIPEPADRREVAGSTFARSGEVRRSALLRAAGVCEHCQAPGFKTESGAVYLETHHVIPLGEGGPDVEWNVVSLCPNDHRRAHYGKDRATLRAQLVDHLVAVHPLARVALCSLLSGNLTPVSGS